MSDVMTENEEERDVVRTSIEIDETVWRKLRARAVEDGAQVSEKLEAVLREYFEIEEADT